MSHLKTSKPSPLNLDSGFGIHANVKVSAARTGVLFQAGDQAGRVRITVALDLNGDLIFRAQAGNGRVEAGPIPKRKFLNKWVVLSAEIAQRPDEIELELTAGDVTKSATGSPLDLPANLEVKLSVGADLDGRQESEMSLGHVMAYSRKLEPTERLALKEFLEKQ